MKNVIILGASGNIAKHVIDILVRKDDINLTLFLRNARRLRNSDLSKSCIIEGDVLNYDELKEAITGQDIVYANLAGDLETMAKNIVTAMEETGIQKIIFISSIGIYDVPLRPVLQPYRKSADVIEASGLEYTILRPTSKRSVRGMWCGPRGGKALARRYADHVHDAYLYCGTARRQSRRLDGTRQR